MQLAHRIRLLGAFALSLTTLPLAAQPLSDLEPFVDGFVQSRMKAEKVIGVTVSVVHEGQVVLSKGYGYDDLANARAVEADRSLFRPGSISKTFTWTAVMQLVEQGKLDLDADIQIYLPDIQIAKNFPEPITMLDLMAHAPGFEDSALGHLFEGNAEDVLPLKAYLQTHQPQQVRPPNTLASYSNYGTALAGQIVANLSGMPFEEYVEKNLFEPLGMRNTTFKEPITGDLVMDPRLVGNVSKGYMTLRGRAEPTDFVFVSPVGPAGAMSVTAADMARWMLLHLGNGQLEGVEILKPATAELMHQQHRTADEALPGSAHGFIESDFNGYRAYGHSGGTVHFLSDMQIIPALNLGIFISTNTAPGGGKLTEGFASAIVKRYFKPVELTIPITAPEDFAARADRFTGEYLFTRRSFSTVEKLNFPAVQVSAVGDELSLGMGDTPMRLIEVAPLLFQDPDDPDRKVKFFEKDGQIAGFHPWVSIMVAERASGLDAPSRLVPAIGISALMFLFVPVGGWLRRNQPVTQTTGEHWAAWSVYLTSVLWIVALGVVVASFVTLLADTRKVFFDFPNGMLVNGINLNIAAAVLTVVCILLLYPVWKHRSWSGWRRIRHTIIVLSFVVLTVILNHLNVLGHNYFS